MLNRRTSMLPVSKQKVSKMTARQRAISTQTESINNDLNLSFCNSEENDSMKRDYLKAISFINSCHKCINDTIRRNINGTDSFLLPKIADYSKLFGILIEQKSAPNAEIHNQKNVTEIADFRDENFELLEIKQEIIHEILEDSQFLDEISSRIYAKTISEQFSKNEECHKCINNAKQKNINGTSSLLLLKTEDYYSKLLDIGAEQNTGPNIEMHNQNTVTEGGDAHDQKFELLEVKQEIIHEISEDSKFLDEISSRVQARTTSEQPSKNENALDKTVVLPDLEQLPVPKEPVNLEKSKYASVENDSPPVQSKFFSICLSSLSLDSNSSEIKTDSDLE